MESVSPAQGRSSGGTRVTLSGVNFGPSSLSLQPQVPPPLEPCGLQDRRSCLSIYLSIYPSIFLSQLCIICFPAPFPLNQHGRGSQLTCLRVPHLQVKFGEAAALRVERYSDTVLTCTSPSHAEGPVSVRVLVGPEDGLVEAVGVRNETRNPTAMQWNALRCTVWLQPKGMGCVPRSSVPGLGIKQQS